MIKEATIEDAVIVHNQIPEFDSHPKEFFENRYGLREKLIIIFYENSQPAGYLIGYDHLAEKAFYCWMVGVLPHSRGRGVLKEMINYQETWAKAHGYEKIKIKTRNNRREMLSFLVKYGFNFMAVDQKQSVDDNEIFLEKSLI